MQGRGPRRGRVRPPGRRSRQRSSGGSRGAGCRPHAAAPAGAAAQHPRVPSIAPSGRAAPPARPVVGRRRGAGPPRHGAPHRGIPARGGRDGRRGRGGVHRAPGDLSGIRAAGRPRGPAWTLDEDKAAWFARRFAFGVNGQVYAAEDGCSPAAGRGRAEANRLRTARGRHGTANGPGMEGTGPVRQKERRRRCAPPPAEASSPIGGQDRTAPGRSPRPSLRRTPRGSGRPSALVTAPASPPSPCR